jgi:diguanylate cyclase (GGDEF)-like protein/PAS domain S-box-containing protein
MKPRLPPFDVLLGLLPDAICVVDADGRFLFVSEGFRRIFGHAPEEVVGRSTFDLVHPDDRAATREQASRVMAGSLQLHFRNRYVHKDGHTVDVQWSARWLPDYGVRIAVAHEVTELRRGERELEHRASHDPLTDLPNRHHLHLELQRAIARAAQTGDGLAVLYLDLDGFKAANDRGGHDAGDRILREVAHRLRDGVRQGDMTARVGGDEFVVLLPGCRDAAAAGKAAEALRARLHRPYSLPDGPIQLDASIGIGCYPQDGQDAEALLVFADHAMYAAKRQAAAVRGAMADR